MQKQIKKFILATAAGVVITGCGSGSNNYNNNKLPSSFKCVNGVCSESGALSPTQLTSFMAQSNVNKTNSKQLQISPDATIITNTLGIAGALYPPAGPIINYGTRLYTIGATIFDKNKPSPTALLNQQLAQLTQELSGVESQIMNDQNIFYNYVVNTENQTANANYNNFYTNINLVAGNLTDTTTENTNSVYYLYNLRSNLSQPNANLDNFSNNFPVATATASSSNTMSSISSISADNTFGPALAEISNSQVCSTNNGESIVVTSFNDNLCGQAQSASVINQLYASLKDELVTQLSSIKLGTAGSVEAGSIINQYNNTVATIYQNALTALQTSYMIEVNNNLLNYLAVTNGYSTQVIPYNQIGSISLQNNVATCNGGCTSFYIPGSNLPTESSIYQSAFNSASWNLAMVYVGRVNQLINATIPYIVSDSMINGQNLPNSQMTQDYVATTVNYNGTTYDVLSPQQLYAKTIPTESLNFLPSGALSSGSFFYQYIGLYDYIACAESGATNCTSFFPYESSPYYDGGQIAVYANTNNTVLYESGILLTNVNNITTCASPNAQTFAVWYNSNQSTGYLMCNNGNGYNSNWGTGKRTSYTVTFTPVSYLNQGSSYGYVDIVNDNQGIYFDFDKEAASDATGQCVGNGINSIPVTGWDNAGSLFVNISYCYTSYNLSDDTYINLSINPNNLSITNPYACKNLGYGSGPDIANCTNMITGSTSTLQLTGSGSQYYVGWSN